MTLVVGTISAYHRGNVAKKDFIEFSPLGFANHSVYISGRPWAALAIEATKRACMSFVDIEEV